MKYKSLVNTASLYKNGFIINQVSNVVNVSCDLDLNLDVTCKYICKCNKKYKRIYYIVTNKGNCMENMILRINKRSYIGCSYRENIVDINIDNLNSNCKETIYVDLCSFARYDIKASLISNNIIISERCISV